MTSGADCVKRREDGQNLLVLLMFEIFNDNTVMYFGKSATKNISYGKIADNHSVFENHMMFNILLGNFSQLWCKPVFFRTVSVGIVAFQKSLRNASNHRSLAQLSDFLK